jgi:hypothetical protein
MREEDFPLERVFCLVGTNPADYDVARGLSSKLVGARSDGLVQIDNAYVPDARRAFVHRSHSGRYGIVNSEEGYQNLRRFLFGDFKVTSDLVGVKLPGERDDDIVWQAEVRLSIRGLPILLQDRVAAHYCPIQLESPGEDGDADRPVPLVTTFLAQKLRPQDVHLMRYALHVRVLSLRQQGGVFGFFDHIEQTADFDDVLVVDVEPRGDSLAGWAEWTSRIPGPVRPYLPAGDPLRDEDPAGGTWQTRVPLPEAARRFLGDDAAVQIGVTAR